VDSYLDSYLGRVLGGGGWVVGVWDVKAYRSSLGRSGSQHNCPAPS
jgi:hypothetical protein